jgi:SAM-dependent methyltransferase
MLTDDLRAFVRAALPPPPAHVLEVGAGSGELAAELRAGGYEVTAVDPVAEEASDVDRAALLEVRGSFDAALAVVSLHHVEPLEDSCAHLATLLGAGAPLVVDEFDVERLDERAATWWLCQRRAVGAADEHEPAGLIAFMRHHVHALSAMREALAPHFLQGEPVGVPYLHRWNLEPGLRDVEQHLIATGRLPATGARWIATRRAAT